MTSKVVRVLSSNIDAATKLALTGSGFNGGKAQTRLLFSKEFGVTAVVGAKSKEAPSIRKFSPIEGNAKHTAEGFNMFINSIGAALALHRDDQLKTKKSPVHILELEDAASSKDIIDWNQGLILAQAQNTARMLMETPANHMTPTIFAQTAQDMLSKVDNVTVNVYDKVWASKQGMGSFISVSNGSAQELRFLELIYKGGKSDDKPIALVGKGVTFDSGGISLKPSNDMALMKADMGGAAVVLSAFRAAAQMKLKINLVVTIPLTENMPSGSSTKPGDVVRAMNQKTIEVDNTDAEGRLILADAIFYTCKTHQPRELVEFSTLTGAMDVALGSLYTGVFSNSSILFEKLEIAGKVADDKFWRMPLDKEYLTFIKSNVADLKNTGNRSAGSCTAAIFLNEFVTKDVAFAHCDIAGVMHAKGPSGILGSGMSGRPTRSIVEFLAAQRQD